MYLLALHPDVCTRLRDEVLDTFGPAGAPTYGHLKKMEYRAFDFPHFHFCALEPFDLPVHVRGSACCAQGDPPPLPLRPARRAYFTR
jgi:hypothetical protein